MEIKVIKIFSLRLLSSVILLFLLISLIFFIIRLAPGDPTQRFLSPDFSPQLAKEVYSSFNLDQPIITQYFSFIGNFLKGNFGTSYNYRQPVLSVLSGYFYFTLVFSFLCFAIQFYVSYLLVKIVIKKPAGIFDHFLNKFSLIVYSTPSFVLGIILILIFSVKLNLLPTSGISSINHDDLSFLSRILDYSKHLILPLITLSLAGISVFYRYLRDSVEDVYNQQMVVSLRSDGFSENEIFKKHVLPNALRPLISIAGIEFGILLGGALITEVIFSLPGMGRLTVSAIFNRDFPLVIGCTFIAGVMMILSNLISDIIKVKLDKRLFKDLIE